jgi:hypothetical protein
MEIISKRKQGQQLQDLKAHFQAEKYLHGIFNTLEIDEKTIINHPQLAAIRQIGAVNKQKIAA